MTTVINNPGNSEGADTAVILIVGIAVVVLVTLFLVYVLPTIRDSGAPEATSIDVNVELPAQAQTATK
jgi:Na+-transporting methylmalonyl-CoA/oxaloacetate decarboxylase gamma subunit